MLHRAYSLLTITKVLDAERRIIRGLATTPDPDRHGDVIEPLGVSFKNPLPLLLFHDTQRPVAMATFAAPTEAGVAFEATIAEVAEAGSLRARVDEAWQSIKPGVITGVSIGFRALEVAEMKTGFRFLKTEVVELSLVTIPANASATILTVKQLAATGRHAPGVAGMPIVRVQKGTPAMTTAEQITQWS